MILIVSSMLMFGLKISEINATVCLASQTVALGPGDTLMAKMRQYMAYQLAARALNAGTIVNCPHCESPPCTKAEHACPAPGCAQVRRPPWKR